MNNGIVYVATGKFNYVVSCGCSILSVKRFSDVPITILTDSPVVEALSSIADVKVVKIPDDPKLIYPSRWVKTQLAKFTPYDRTLFLDSDILCVDRFDELWDYSDDLIIAADVYPVKYIDGVRYAYYNTGVILFDRNKTVDLFEDWHNRWLETGKWDQPSFAVALSKWGGTRNLVDKFVYNWNVRDARSKFVHYWHGVCNLSVFPKEDVLRVISMLDPDGSLR
jgi:hypothetical protein